MRKFFFPLFIFFLLLFSVFSYLFIDQNLVFLQSIYSGFATENRGVATIIYFIFILLFYVFYFYILRNQKGFNLKKIILVTCAILFFSYPAILSYDIFNYVLTSKLALFYNENPYIVMPIEFTGDPLLLFTRAANKIALYGPVWIGISGISYIFGFNNFLLTIFNFKLLAILFYLGTVFLIARISKNRESVFLFALNPLVLIETLVSSHNDIVMMFFALLSFYLLRKKRLFLGLVSILASILIKYSTIFLFPVFFYTFFKKIRKEEVDWEKIYFFSSISMFVIFFLSFLREEIYPWYAIWFLVFSCLVPHRKILFYLSTALSLGLLLSYIPYIFSGTYFGSTPILKTVLIFTPVILTLVFLKTSKSRLVKWSG